MFSIVNFGSGGRQAGFGIFHIGTSDKLIVKPYGCHHSTTLGLINGYHQTGASTDATDSADTRCHLDTIPWSVA